MKCRICGIRPGHGTGLCYTKECPSYDGNDIFFTKQEIDELLIVLDWYYKHGKKFSEHLISAEKKLSEDMR